MTLSISPQSRKRLPALPWRSLMRAVLPAHFDLSLVAAPSTLSRRLNKSRRGKDEATNILTFPLSPRSGEIFIDLAVAKRDAMSFGMRFRDFVALLFIHGALHLRGEPHGDRMERTEARILRRFGFQTPKPATRSALHTHGTTLNRRNRHRKLSGARRRRPRRAS